MLKQKQQNAHGEGRRDFLSRLIGIWALVTAVPLGAVAMKFITPRRNTVGAVESLRLGSISEITTNSAKIYRFNKEPIIVVHTETGQFKAFSARCTHLGCVVQYTTEGTPRFKCNCHQSEFDLNGKNIAGPAPLPLSPLRVALQDSSIVVSKV